MKIATRLKCSSYGSVGVILIFLPLLAWSLARTDTLTHHDHLADEIQLNAYERITFSDDFILYQTDRSKAQWLSATEKVGSLLKKASATLSGKQERQVLAEMQENFDDTVAIFGRIVEEAGRLARSGGIDFHHSDLGKRLSTQLVVKNSTFQGETYRLQKLTERNLEQANRRSVFLTSLFIFLIAASTGLNSFFLNRVMHRRLEALHSGAKTIAGGNLNFRIGDCGRDEFGDLAATINLMTAMVAESREELEKYAQKLLMVEEDLRRDVAHELHEEIVIRQMVSERGGV